MRASTPVGFLIVIFGFSLFALPAALSGFANLFVIFPGEQADPCGSCANGRVRVIPPGTSWSEHCRYSVGESETVPLIG